MRSLPPLESIKYYVLLAIALEPLTGYGIREQVQTDSNGNYYLGMSTIYSTLRSLLRAGYIEIAESIRTPKQVRTAYRLTDQGHKILRMHAVTFGDSARLARQRLHYGA